MSTEHLLLAASNDGARWVLLLRDYSGACNVFSTGAGSLEARVAFLIETMQTRPGANLSFSTRPLAEVQAAGLIEDAAAVRTAVPGASLHIMAPAAPRSMRTCGARPGAIRAAICAPAIGTRGSGSRSFWR
jgi:hypothetical protein